MLVGEMYTCNTHDAQIKSRRCWLVIATGCSPIVIYIQAFPSYSALVFCHAVTGEAFTGKYLNNKPSM